MQRGGKRIITHQEHRFILNNGALGDIITSLPAIVHAMRSVPMMKLTAYVPPWQKELIAHLLAPYGKIDVRSLEEVPLGRADRLAEWGKDVPHSMNAPAFNTHTRNRVHMIDFAFNYLLDARPESMTERNYPTEAAIGPRTITEDYVVFPVGATSDNKLFRASVMAPILRWVLSQAYKPVIVGTKVSHTHAQMGDGVLEKIVIREQTDVLDRDLFAQCLDMREKTTLLELRDILGHASAVVGVDGGTLHLAATTDAPIVYAMGTTLPKHRYVPRHGDHNYRIKYVVPRDLECAGCQSNATMTRWDFRYCPFDDNACMEALHHEDFINGLKELGL